MDESLRCSRDPGATDKIANGQARETQKSRPEEAPRSRSRGTTVCAAVQTPRSQTRKYCLSRGRPFLKYRAQSLEHGDDDDDEDDDGDEDDDAH